MYLSTWHLVETGWFLKKNTLYRGENFTSLFKSSRENTLASVTPGETLLGPEEPERENQGGGIEVVKTKQDKAMKCLWMPLLISYKMHSSILQTMKKNRTLQVTKLAPKGIMQFVLKKLSLQETTYLSSNSIWVDRNSVISFLIIIYIYSTEILFMFFCYLIPDSNSE